MSKPIKKAKLKKMGVEQFDGTIRFICTFNKCECEHVRLTEDDLKKAKIEQSTKQWWKCTNPKCPYSKPYQEPFDKN